MSTRTIITQELRPFKIDVYGLQDNYIGTLQSYNDNFIGQLVDPQIKLSLDGSQTFTCSIPKYIIDPITNEKKQNSRWGDIENGILAENTRILKVFVIFENETKVFPFIVDKITDKRDKHFQVFKEIECSGLAFAELGKLGYKLELKQELVELELEEKPDTLMTIQYWLDQVFPNVKNESGKIIEWTTPWCYEIKMDWSYHSDGGRESDKIYDDGYTNSWIIDEENKLLLPDGYTERQEKSRPVDCYNSNKYNITQELAEAFEVFCQYEYKCAANGCFIKKYIDENNNAWTGKKVVFYNRAVKQEEPLYIDYQKNLQSISRTSDSSELFTKLYITPTESSVMENGYVTIADTLANPTLDDFILNFDYLYQIGSISDYQLQFVKEYETTIRKINSQLMYQSPILNNLATEINNGEAELAGLNKQVEAAKEQLVYYEKLRDNELTNGTVVKDKANSCSAVFVPESDFYKATLHFEGIVKSTIVGYKDNTYEDADKIFSANDLIETKQMVSPADNKYYLLVDEDGYPTTIYTKNNTHSVIYLALEYSPKNKYESICNRFQGEINQKHERINSIKANLETLKNNQEQQQKAYDDKLLEKNKLNEKLEVILGPALREGYWTPDKYDDPGQYYHEEFSIPEIKTELSGNSFFFDIEPFENEQLPYIYDNSISEGKTYFPYFQVSSLMNEWKEHSLDDLIIHLQRDFIGEVQETTEFSAGNYYFLYNNKKYYFTLEKSLNKGDVLKVSVEGNKIQLYLNNTNIILSNFLPNALSNITSFFEGTTDSLGDYYLYNNAGFIFSFMNINGSTCEPILLFNNSELLSVYKNYSRLAYSFQGDSEITLIENKYIESNTKADGTQKYNIYYPRIALLEDNVFYSSDTLIIKVKSPKEDEAIKLKKFYDYFILLRGGKTYITLKITTNNPIWKLIDKQYNYQVDYRSSRANELLYLDAKQVAKDNSHPKFSYDLSVAIIPKNIEKKLRDSSFIDEKKIQAIEMGQLVYINDPILGVRAATGYVSEITYVLEKPYEDEIKIQNYKTKFEDLFSTITASSEAMKNNQISYDIAAKGFEPNGAISGSVLQSTINNNNLSFNYSTTGVEISPTEGIILTNQKPYLNGVYGQVVLQGGGIFLSKDIDPATGERIWSTGITPDGINASQITAGQLNTGLIKIFSGDELAFQWNNEGIYAYKFNENNQAMNNIYIKYSQEGIHYTKETINEDGTLTNPLHIVSLDWEGLTLRNNKGQKTLQMDAETGNVRLSGTLQSFNYYPGILGQGWRIDENGVAEFNDVNVRGTISASVFKYDETTAVGGEIYIAPTLIFDADKTREAVIEYGSTSAPNYLIFGIDSPFGTEYNYAGREWKGGELVGLNGKIINKNDPSEFYSIKNLRTIITVLKHNNGNLILRSESPIYTTTQNIFYDKDGLIKTVGEVFGENFERIKDFTGAEQWNLIFMGSSGIREGIILTAMRSDGPYIDILDDNPNDTNDKSPRARLGNLDGLKDFEAITKVYPNIGGYGLYSDNVYLTGAIYATSGRIGSLSIDEVVNKHLNIIPELGDRNNFIINISNSDYRPTIYPKLIINNSQLEETYPSEIKSITYRFQYRDTSKENSTWVNFNQKHLEWKDNTRDYTFVNSTTQETILNREYRVEFKITYTNNNTIETIYSAPYSYNAIENGEQGEDGESGQNAVQYKLIANATSIVRDLVNPITPEELTFTINKIEGGTITSLSSTSGFSLSGTIYKNNESTQTVDISNFELNISSYTDETYKSLVIYLKQGAKTVDVLTLPFELGDDLRELGKIQDGQVIINDGKVYADAIYSGAVTAEKIAAGAVEADKIAANSINTSHIASEFDLTIGSKRSINITADGTFTIDSNNFKIDSSGNVTLTGIINATKGGKIGNWYIGEYSLTSGSGDSYVAISTYTGNQTDPYRIWAGDEAADAAPFSVTASGALKAQKGTIGGFTIDKTKLTGGSDEQYFVGLASTGTYRIWAGAETPDEETPFYVKSDGSIRATRGKIGGWTIGTDSLYAGSGDSYVALNTNVNNEYAIWAGNSIPKDADFAVKKDGTVYLKKLIALSDKLDANGNPIQTEVNLTQYPLWKLNHKVITDYSANSITLSGGPTINFINADAEISVGGESGYVYPIIDGEEFTDNYKAVFADPNNKAEVSGYNSEEKTALVFFDLLLGSDTVIRRDFVTADVSSIYSKGASDVSVSDISNVYYNWINMGGGRYQTTVTFNVILSNGKTIPKSVRVDHTVT